MENVSVKLGSRLIILLSIKISAITMCPAVKTARLIH